jgi:O-antigen/teichoic acid export membrane protein
MAIRPIFTDAAWLLVGQIANRGCMFSCGALVATRLGPSSFSEFTFLAITSGMFATIGSAGLGSALARSFSSSNFGRSSTLSEEIVAACLLVVAGIAGTILIIAVAYQTFLPSSQMHIRTPLMVATVSQLLSGVGLNILIGTRKFKAAALANFLSGIVLILVGYLGVRAKLPSLVIWAVPLSYSSYVMLTSVTVIPSLRSAFCGTPIRAAMKRAVSVLAFSGSLFSVSMLSVFAPWALGVLLLRASEIEFAAYAAALQWFGIVLLAPNALSNAYLPRLFRKFSQPAPDASQDAKRLLLESALVSTLLAAVIALGVAVGANILSELHGAVLKNRIEVLRIFACAAVVVAPLNALGNGLIARNKHLIWVALTIIWLITMLGMAILLPAKSARTAGYVFLASYMLFLILTAMVLREKGKTAQ